mmetsp:Transcript_26553/g.60492  ORF Transcript_26553/g.60492 Transcript_26553/m.60492 type:complete len:332 (-) Transcript_26553:197-1192(-)
MAQARAAWNSRSGGSAATAGRAAALLRPRRLALAALLLGSSSPAMGKDLGSGWKEKTNNEGKVVQELKIEAPSFTEEDQYGYTMPDRYRCDSCKAVMFHLDKELRKKQPKSRRLKQWEFTDVFDDTCRGPFEGYGIRLINGENALSGPGLKQEEQIAPGSGAIQMGGESWGKRLGEVCRKIVYEKLGEDETYDLFWDRFSSGASGPALTEELCATELRECVVGPNPPPKEKAKKEKKEKAKAKKPKAPAAKAEAPSRAEAAQARTPSGASPAAAGAAASGERVSVEAFLRELAVRHGLTPDEYLSARTVAEWERLQVAIASRLFNSRASEL